MYYVQYNNKLPWAYGSWLRFLAGFHVISSAMPRCLTTIAFATAIFFFCLNFKNCLLESYLCSLEGKHKIWESAFCNQCVL